VIWFYVIHGEILFGIRRPQSLSQHNTKPVQIFPKIIMGNKARFTTNTEAINQNHETIVAFVSVIVQFTPRGSH
jgi:hypothetical protein